MRSPLLADEILADIQGFITSGYGHLSHAAYLFVQIHDVEQGQRWLARLAPEITSSRPWPVGPKGPTPRLFETSDFSLLSSNFVKHQKM